MLSEHRELDLGSAGGIAALRRLDARWRDTDGAEILALLERIRITIPPRVVTESDLVVLPGGAVAVRDPAAGPMVADPARTQTFTGQAAIALRLSVAEADSHTLLHGAAGLVCRPGVPRRLSPQAVTVLRNWGLPGCDGPAAIQWFAGGATAWPLAPAPSLLALAATASGVPIPPHADPIAPDAWHALGHEARRSLLSPGVTERASDLLAADLSDDLRFAVIDACVSGDDCVIGRMAAALGVLPACFRAGAAARPGEPPMDWKLSIRLIRGRVAPNAMLGVVVPGDARDSIACLRVAMAGRRASVLEEARTLAVPVVVALDSETALFVGRHAGTGGRLGVIFAAPDSPATLYAIAASVAEALGTSVIASAPCWGFCHHIGPDGGETGNATWFGLGAALDELEDL